MEIGEKIETIQITLLFDIDQNTESSPGDIKRLAVSHIPVKTLPSNTGVRNLEGLL